MLIVHVHVQVVPDGVEQFLEATHANANASLEEAGVLRFDMIQDAADPNHIVLVEVYRDQEAADAHKETEHYLTWREAVADLMATPRTSQKFTAVFPEDPRRWDTPGS